jgi:outer membrane murein-binding lipoprotein Lpp
MKLTRTAFGVVLILCSALLASCDGGENDRLKLENDELQSQNDELQSKIQSLESALEEANDHIRDAASEISDAQSYSYADCGSLRFAVQSMTEPDEVEAP